ncbi:MAG: D-arabinono-1,4-lactone oxidase [Reyranellaceae bacterium]
MASWTNWAGNVECHPARLAEPGDVGEIAALMREAAAQNLPVRVAGSGHSFTPVAACDGMLLSLGRLSGVLKVDRQGQWADIAAGTRIAGLGAALQSAGLALANQGDVDVQALAGAISTGTHGTGRELGSLSTMVRGLTLVAASGDRISIDEAEIDVLRAASLSLGTFGVVVGVRLALVPAYRLHERVWREPIGQAMERLDEHILGNRHFEFFWLPESDEAECKALHPTPDDPGTALMPGERIDWSWRIFPSERVRKFVESEWSVPAAVGPQCFAAIRDLMSTRHSDVKWPVEYRTLAADELPLSPAYGRDSVAISIHQGAGRPWEEFFRDAQAIFRGFGGRPHWGKWHSLTARDFAAHYPKWDEFNRLRRRFDLTGRLLTPYLREILE